MITYRAISFGRGFNAHRFAIYAVLRLLPHPWARDAIGAVGASIVNRQQGGRPSAPGERVASAVRQLHEHGFVEIDPLLSPGEIVDVRAFLARQPALVGSEHKLVDESTRGIQRASYPVATILACPHILDLINTPDLLDIAAGYLGCKPTITTVGIHWSFPGDWAPSSVQTYHRDQEQWRFIKFFVYLTDVDMDSGAHRFLLGSHRSMGRLRLASYSNEEVEEGFGQGKVRTVIGKKGTNFAEDTWGIHRGIMPVTRARLMVDVMYAVGAVPIYEDHPIRVEGAERYDRYVNRLIVA